MTTVFQCDECGKIHQNSDTLIGLYLSFRDKGETEHEEILDGLFCDKKCLGKFITTEKLHKLIVGI